MRPTNKQQAAARRNNSNIVNVEARINRKNEKNNERQIKLNQKAEKKERANRKKAKAKMPDEDKLLHPKLTRFLKVTAVLILAVLLVRFGLNIYDLKKQEREALAAREALKLQEVELEKYVSLKDTPDYLEQQARNILHMILPGEILYIPDPDAAQKNRQNTSGEAIIEAKPSSGDEAAGDEE